MGRNWALIGLGVVAAGAAGWWASSLRREAPAPVVIIQAPAAPAVAAPVADPAPKPAAAAVRPAARPAPLPVAKSAPRPAPAPAPAATPEPEAPPAPPAPEPRREERAASEEQAPVRPPAVFPEYKLPPPPAPEPRSVTIPAGTLITVRLNQPLSSERNSEGDAFSATLDQPLVVNGLVIAERGSRQMGKVSLMEQSGRVKGRAALNLELVALNTADGQNVAIATETFRHEAESTTGRDVAKAGVLTGIGAAIGAMAGGGRGAAIGAAAGGAAGAGTVLATRGRDARLPAETRISFRLKQPVVLTEKLN
jgi:hypothetical protein